MSAKKTEDSPEVAVSENAEKNDNATPIEHRGGPGSVSGRNIQESSDEVRAKEMGVTGTRETTLAGLDGAAPVVDHEEAAADEAKRQRSDDERRRHAREAEAEAQEALHRVHVASSPQFDDDGKPLYNDLGQQLDSDGNVVVESPPEAEDKRKRL